MRALAALAALLLAACHAADAPTAAGPTARAASAPDGGPQVTPVDLGHVFGAEGGVGTFVMLDTATGERLVHDTARASERITPASTSKVFNGLVFLDRGVVTDIDELYPWDGVERSIRPWNRDHSLRTGTEVSAVWLFQRLAGRVGREGYADVFARQPYGNSALSDSLEMSWLDGTWTVSAHEQVGFFDALRRGELAFAPEHQALAREILPVLGEGDGWRLLGKTGWGLRGSEPDVGWLVGWVERAGGDAVYAMNVEDAGQGELDMMRGRLRIVRAALAEFGVLEHDAP